MDIEKIASERNRLKIQMQVDQIFAVVQVVKPPVNFLVFGLGNDSIFWHNLNKGGRAVFIEDNREWFDSINKQYPFLESYLVDYGTKRSQWREYIDMPEKLNLALPEGIIGTKWDVILVDGPVGYSDERAGRMKSIYMASRLIKTSGDVFVHDAEREVERAYCDKFLLTKNLIGIIGEKATLHHYKANS